MGQTWLRQCAALGLSGLDRRRQRWWSGLGGRRVVGRQLDGRCRLRRQLRWGQHSWRLWRRWRSGGKIHDPGLGGLDEASHPEDGDVECHHYEEGRQSGIHDIDHIMIFACLEMPQINIHFISLEIPRLAVFINGLTEDTRWMYFESHDPNLHRYHTWLKHIRNDVYTYGSTTQLSYDVAGFSWRSCTILCS